MRKKSYNPFTMGGTLAGLIVGIVAAYFAFTAILVLCDFYSCRWTAVLVPLGIVLVGFVGGWLVHSLFRWSR